MWGQDQVWTLTNVRNLEVIYLFIFNYYLMAVELYGSQEYCTEAGCSKIHTPWERLTFLVFYFIKHFL